jgi:hypothetical protein
MSLSSHATSHVTHFTCHCISQRSSQGKAKSLATGAVNDAGGVAAARGRGSSEGAFHLSTPIHSSLPISHYSLITL